jgi:hypothetical protein
MKQEQTAEEHKEDEPKSGPHRVRLPGFLVEDEIGLGDLVKRITYSMGLKTCRGCEGRRATLNQWMHFVR